MSLPNHLFPNFFEVNPYHASLPHLNLTNWLMSCPLLETSPNHLKRLDLIKVDKGAILERLYRVFIQKLTEDFTPNIHLVIARQFFSICTLVFIFNLQHLPLYSRIDHKEMPNIFPQILIWIYWLVKRGWNSFEFSLLLHL